MAVILVVYEHHQKQSCRRYHGWYAGGFRAITVRTQAECRNARCHKEALSEPPPAGSRKSCFQRLFVSGGHSCQPAPDVIVGMQEASSADRYHPAGTIITVEQCGYSVRSAGGLPQMLRNRSIPALHYPNGPPVSYVWDWDKPV